MWVVFGGLSALFASLTAIFSKLGIRKTDSTLATALRTGVVLIFSWVMVFVGGAEKEIFQVDGRSLLFLCLSGVMTGASWLFYYSALKNGVTTVVVALDKSSVFFTVLFGFLIFKETLSKKSLLGLLIMLLGTSLLVVENFF